jgi:hypothetical protein
MGLEDWRQCLSVDVEAGAVAEANSISGKSEFDSFAKRELLTFETIDSEDVVR